MKPIFLDEFESFELEQAINENRLPTLDENIIDELISAYIIVNSDDGVLENIRAHAPSPYINLAYFILTEQCNLACKYCMQGNSVPSLNRRNFPLMSLEVAARALDFFVEQVNSDESRRDMPKEIIFYGGEPLLNFRVMKFVIEEGVRYQNEGVITGDLNFSVVTNGLLLDEQKIDFFIEKNVSVSISIDGPSAVENSCRINKHGENVFKSLLDKVNLARSKGLRFGFSVTLTELTLKNLDGLVTFIKQNGLDSVSFNILIKKNDVFIDEDYYVNATKFIIDFYKQTKDEGIREDRLFRKLRSFVDSKIYFSDCGATAGSQVVIMPNGDVGICHGNLTCGDNFIGTIFDKDFIVSKNEKIIEWSQMIPIFNRHCESCEALGICGGGCPINAGFSEQNSNFTDYGFCIHAKEMLNFLLSELLRISVEK